MEEGLGLGRPGKFHTHMNWARKEERKGIPGRGPGIFKDLEVHKIMGSLGNSKRLFVAGAEGAW